MKYFNHISFWILILLFKCNLVIAQSVEHWEGDPKPEPILTNEKTYQLILTNEKTYQLTLKLPEVVDSLSSTEVLAKVLMIDACHEWNINLSPAEPLAKMAANIRFHTTINTLIQQVRGPNPPKEALKFLMALLNVFETPHFLKSGYVSVRILENLQELRARALSADIKEMELEKTRGKSDDPRISDAIKFLQDLPDVEREKFIKELTDWHFSKEKGEIGIISLLAHVRLKMANAKITGKDVRGKEKNADIKRDIKGK